MSDWKPTLLTYLGDLSLSRQQYDELIEELCAHLDDRYAELQSEGISAIEAHEICLEEIAALRSERSHIERAKGAAFPMNSRTRTIWLPGFVSASASSIAMMAIGRNSSGISNQLTFVYVTWLMLLPFCGAAGAWLSRKWNGSISARLTSGLFPSLVMAGAFLLIVPFDLLITRHGDVIHHPTAFLQAVTMWIITPAVALLAGAAPFCREKSYRLLSKNQELGTRNCP